MIRKIVNKIIHLDYPIKRHWYIHWNAFKFKSLGAKLGDRSIIRNKVYLFIGRGAKVEFGSFFAINSGDNLIPLCSNIYCSIHVRDNARLKIGDWSGISGGCIWATDSITIGNHVNIGANCVIMDGDIHNMDWRVRRTDRISPIPIPFEHKPIVIEDDVWLGTGSIVLKGVTIGARSIIGAGSVVTKDIPSDCIAAGNPCKVIRRLDNE